MAVYIGITMTRKMLGTCEYPSRLHAFNELAPPLGNFLWVRTQTAIPYNRIFRVGVYVHHRCKIEAKTQFFEFQTHLMTHSIRPLRVMLRTFTNLSHRRNIATNIFEAHDTTSFLVYRHQGRNSAI